MRINFGRADIFMAEHSLHRTQIDVMIKQMGRKGMAQNMRSNPFARQSRLKRRRLNIFEKASRVTCPEEETFDGKSQTDFRPAFKKKSRYPIYSETAFRAAGATGTIRSLLPLPFTIICLLS